MAWPGGFPAVPPVPEDSAERIGGPMSARVPAGS